MSMQSNYPRPNPNLRDAVPCPRCGQVAGKRLRYTWWGGAVGPAMMSLTQCQACGYQFNAKTGQSTKKAVIAYNVIALAIGIVIVVGYFLSKS